MWRRDGQKYINQWGGSHVLCKSSEVYTYTHTHIHTHPPGTRSAASRRPRSSSAEERRPKTQESLGLWCQSPIIAPVAFAYVRDKTRTSHALAGRKRKQGALVHPVANKLSACSPRLGHGPIIFKQCAELGSISRLKSPPRATCQILRRSGKDRKLSCSWCLTYWMTGKA